MAGRGEEAEKALREIADPAVFAGANDQGAAEGRVTLVGAGPGDPDLLTVKGLRALLRDRDAWLAENRARIDEGYAAAQRGELFDADQVRVQMEEPFLS